jgi:hypothetical protein
MSHSAKNNLKINKALRKNDFIATQIEKRDSSSEKPRKRILDLKNIFYKSNPEKKIDSDLIILNYITNKSETKFSAKTSLSDAIPDKLDYNLCMINKYDENLDTSLSFISDFDLEQDENQNDSFSSSDNDGECIEQFEIKSDIKIDSNKRGSINDKKEIDLELEKDWNEIQALLLNKKPSS